MKKTFSLLAILALILSFGVFGKVGAETSYAGQIVKMDGLDTLYYVGSDNQRYVFPNKKTYDTWFADFDDVVTLSAEEIQAIPLVGNVRYRPGVVLVKITTDPKVYAVSNNGVLRWVRTEALAREIYGDNWNLLVDDIPDSFFTNYTTGTAIESESDYDAEEETDGTDTIDKDRGLSASNGKKADSDKCRAIPAVPAHKNNGVAIPATPASRICHLENGHGNSDSSDKTAPAITAVAATNISSTAATIGWTTDEDATSEVQYATKSLSDSTATILTVSSTDKVKSHSLNLTGLATSTLYYYLVKSADAAGNIATSSEYQFTTIAE